MLEIATIVINWFAEASPVFHSPGPQLTRKFRDLS